ncbi:MAG: NB-ARC domain-containing protein [Candidatus Asgardarchaeia archaeon]
MIDRNKITLQVIISKQSKNYNEFYIGKDKNVVFTIEIINKNDEPIPKGSILKFAVPVLGFEFKSIERDNIKPLDSKALNIKIFKEIPRNGKLSIPIILIPKEPISNLPYNPVLHVPSLDVPIYGAEKHLVIHDPQREILFETTQDYQSVLNIPTESIIDKNIINLNIQENLRENFDKLVPINIAIKNTSSENKDYHSLHDIVNILLEEKPKITIITGPEFSGKTTLAGTLLTLEEYNKNPQESIIIAASMAEYSKNPKKLTQIVFEKYNELYAENNTQKLYSISAIASKHENRKVKIILDLDFWFCNNAIPELSDLLETINDYDNINLILIVKEETLRNFMKNTNIKGPLEKALTIKVLPLPIEEAIRIISEQSKVSDNHAKEIIRKLVEHDPEHFTRAPYIAEAIRVIKRYKTMNLLSEKNQYLHLKIIIETIHNLFKQTFRHLDSKYVNNILEDFKMIPSDNEEPYPDPEFFRAGKITAIDYEANFIVQRSADHRIKAYLNNEKTQILFVTGKSGTGKTTLARRAAYEAIKDMKFVSFYNILDSDVNAIKEINSNVIREHLIVLDDTHLDDQHKKLTNINQSINKNKTKIIATERAENKILPKIVNKYKQIRQAPEGTQEDIIAELALDNKAVEYFLTPMDFREITEGLVKALENYGLKIDQKYKNDISEIIDDLAKKTEETIHLLIFVLQKYIDENKTLTAPIDVDIGETINKTYVNIVRRKVERKINEKNDLKKITLDFGIKQILRLVSTFSRYELAVPYDVLSKFFSFNRESISGEIELIFNTLVTIKEIGKIMLQQLPKSISAI